jgi:Tfp pilus assembly protein PilV
MKRPLTCRRGATKNESGMTIVEVLLAGLILVVGMLSLTGLIIMAIANNGRNKKDSTATMLAQQVVEQIATQSVNGANVQVSDCATPTPNTWPIAVASAGGGAPLTANGNIDFTKSPVANYQMNFVVCGTNGRQATYDVRWNVTSLDSFANLVTVAARLKGASGDPNLFAIPVNLRTIVGAGGS